MVESLLEDVRESLGNQVPLPSSLGEFAEFAVLARHVIENRRLNDAVIQLDKAIQMVPK